MFDANFRAFAAVAALLVLSPGASMAVVMETAFQTGRGAALRTVVGINIANSSLALASMFGLSAVLHRWPSMLHAISVCGAAYLGYLGLGALWRIRSSYPANRPGRQRKPAHSKSSAIIRGILTNLLNPSVVLFYTLVLPRFIGSQDPFAQRYLMLAATHVTMSLAWLSCYGLAVGTMSERLARPSVRLSMEILTGITLLALGMRLIF